MANQIDVSANTSIVEVLNPILLIGQSEEVAVKADEEDATGGDEQR